MALEDQIAALATATTELTDQALVTLGESAANADRAELARDFSTQEANRASAAQLAITTELAQVQALAAQVATDKAGVTATLIGSENYIIPAVTQLLSTYTNVVATAISDDIWAEHSHKWGAPKQVLAIAQLDKVTLVDLTKPTFPVFKTITGLTGVRVVALVANFIAWGTATGITVQNASGETQTLPAVINNSINSIATRIADHAPRHPVSGLPMPTIAVATDGGVSELVPTDDGKWTVTNSTQTNKFEAISYSGSGRLYVGNRVLNTAYANYTDGLKANPSLGLLTYSVPSSTGFNIWQTKAGYSSYRARLIASSVDKLVTYKDNQSDPSKGMTAYSDINHSTPYLVGDVQGAWLCGSEEGVVSDVDIKSVFIAPDASSSYISAIGGDVYTFNTPGDWCSLRVASGLTQGVPYLITFTITNSASGGLKLAGASSINQNTTFVGDGTHTVVGMPISTYLELARANATQLDVHVDSVRRLAPDYSGRNNHALVHGSLTRTKPVGSDIAVWSGFSDANYISRDPIDISQPFAITIAAMDANPMFAQANLVDKVGYDGSVFSTRLSNGDQSYSLRSLNFSNFGLDLGFGSKVVTVIYTGTKLISWGDTRKIAELTVQLPAIAGTRLYLGARSYGNTLTQYSSQIACANYTKTIPSDDQIREMHRDMLNKLSKPSVLSGNVKALAYDPIRKQDWVACDSKKLHRLEGTCIVETVAVDTNIGTISSLTVNDGLITVGGSGGTWVKQPEKNLRAPQIRAGKSVRTFELGDGNGTKVDFYLPRGWKPERAYVDGVKKRKGAQDDWTAQFDGYKWFVRFAVAPGAVDIDVDAVEV